MTATAPSNTPALPPPAALAPMATTPALDRISVSEFKSGEDNALTPAIPKQLSIDFHVDHLLPYKKIYAYLWTNPSNPADYFVRCEIRLWRNGTMVGILPLCEGISNGAATGVLKESIVAIAIASTGGVEVQDSIGLFLSAPTGTQPQSVILQPQCLHAEIDRITVAVVSFGNMTDLRLWVGCLSSKS
jgi:hypothetical protein